MGQPRSSEQVASRSGISTRFVRRQNLGCFAHELHARHHQRLRRMVTAKARHLQRIADDAAGLFGQVLQVGVHVVVRHHDGVLFLQQAADFVLQRGALGRVSAPPARGPRRGGAADAGLAAGAGLGLFVVDTGWSGFLHHWAPAGPQSAWSSRWPCTSLVRCRWRCGPRRFQPVRADRPA
jgi:hypothetical protein